MAQYYTEFRGLQQTWPAGPYGWTHRINTAADSVSYGTSGGFTIKKDATGGSQVFSNNSLDGVQDAEIAAEFTITDTAQFGRYGILAGRYSGTSEATTKGISLSFTTVGGNLALVLAEDSHGTISWKNFAWSLNTKYKARLRVIGNDVKGKVWPSSQAEPSDWSLEVTYAEMPVIVNPYWGVTHFVQNSSVTFHSFGYETDGGSAPLEITPHVTNVGHGRAYSRPTSDANLTTSGGVGYYIGNRFFEDGSIYVQAGVGLSGTSNPSTITISGYRFDIPSNAVITGVRAIPQVINRVEPLNMSVRFPGYSVTKTTSKSKLTTWQEQRIGGQLDTWGMDITPQNVNTLLESMEVSFNKTGSAGYDITVAAYEVDVYYYVPNELQGSTPSGSMQNGYGSSGGYGGVYPSALNVLFEPQSINASTSVTDAILKQLHSTVPANLSTATKLDAKAVKQKHSLAVQGLLSSTKIDTAVSIENYILAASDVSSRTELDSMSIPSGYYVLVDGLYTQTGLTTPALTQKHSLGVENASASTGLDSPEPTNNYIFNPFDIKSAVSIDSASLTQNYMLFAEDQSTETFSDTLRVLQSQVFTPNSLSTSTELGSPKVLTFTLFSAPNELSVVVGVDSSKITQAHNLSIEDLLSKTYSDETSAFNWNELGKKFGLYRPDRHTGGALQESEADSGLIIRTWVDKGLLEEVSRDTSGIYKPTNNQKGKY